MQIRVGINGEEYIFPVLRIDTIGIYIPNYLIIRDNGKWKVKDHLSFGDVSFLPQKDIQLYKSLPIFHIYQNGIILDKTQINSRVSLIQTNLGNYIVKDDEQYNANRLSFNTSVIATMFQINTPENVLIDNPQRQIIEYLHGWKDLRIRDLHLLSSEKLSEDLGNLLAFSFFIGLTDQFLYMTRIIDNEYFKDDPEYEYMLPWMYPMINNLGIVKGEIYLIDARPGDYDLKIIRTYLYNEKLVSRIFDVTSEYFELSKEETENLILIFWKKITHLRENSILIDEILKSN